jgi:hypothetical protein
MTRWITVVLVAGLGCGGGGSKQEPAEPAPVAEPVAEEEPLANVAPEEPVEEPAGEPAPSAPVQPPVPTGDPLCDELVRLMWCMTKDVPDAQKAVADASVMYRDALANSASRQATIDACKQAMPSMRDAAKSVGC